MDRPCCNLYFKDFKVYKGDFHEQLENPLFCRHCGQIWEIHSTVPLGPIASFLRVPALYQHWTMSKVLFPSRLQRD